MNIKNIENNSKMCIRLHHIFNDSIIRVNKLNEDPERIKKLFNVYLDTFKFIKMECFNKTVKQFEAIFDGLFKFNMKKITHEDTEICTHKIYVVEMNSPIQLSFEIYNYYYKITNDNTCLYFYMIKAANRQTMDITANIYPLELQKQVMHAMDSLLVTMQDEIKQTESIVINSNIESVWKLITNWKAFQEIDDKIPQLRNNDNDNEWSVYMKDNPSTLFKLKPVPYKIAGIRRTYNIECYTGLDLDCKTILIEFTLVDINNHKCYLAMNHTYYQYVDSITLCSISKDKQNILTSIKRIIEKNIEDKIDLNII